MTFEDILPYIGIVSLLITLFVIVYHFGKWRQKTEAEREEIKKKLETISTKVEKIPEELLAKSVDVYKLYEKIKADAEANKKRRTKDE